MYSSSEAEPTCYVLYDPCLHVVSLCVVHCVCVCVLCAVCVVGCALYRYNMDTVMGLVDVEYSITWLGSRQYRWSTGIV